MTGAVLSPGIAALILFGCFFLFMFLRVPVAFALGLAAVFVWAGWTFTRFAWNRVSELADLPLWMIHIAWPVTGLTWLVFQGERMVDAALVLAGRAPAGNDSGPGAAAT